MPKPLTVWITYAEYIMRNTGLEEAQAGIKIAGRNINNLRYADNTTLMAESEEELILFASWEICMQVRKQQLELDMEQQTGSK